MFVLFKFNEMGLDSFIRLNMDMQLYTASILLLPNFDMTETKLMNTRTNIIKWSFIILMAKNQLTIQIYICTL